MWRCKFWTRIQAAETGYAILPLKLSGLHPVNIERESLRAGSTAWTAKSSQGKDTPGLLEKQEEAQKEVPIAVKLFGSRCVSCCTGICRSEHKEVQE